MIRVGLAFNSLRNQVYIQCIYFYLFLLSKYKVLNLKYSNFHKKIYAECVENFLYIIKNDIWITSGLNDK